MCNHNAETIRIARACIAVNQRWLHEGVIDVATYRRYIRTPRNIIARLERGQHGS